MSLIRASFTIKYSSFVLDIELNLSSRGIIAVLGPSGSGKTTLLRSLAGLEKIDNGYVQINDEVWEDTSNSISIPTYKRKLGYVFQDSNLFPHLSVKKNLLFGYDSSSRDSDCIRIDDVIDLFELKHLLFVGT